MATKSWRDIPPIHPAAELFSCAPVSPDEKRALGEDIIKNGLTSPIVLWKPDRKSPECLLDGITRLDAIEIATGCPAIVGAPSITAGEDFLACNKVIVLDGLGRSLRLRHQRQHPSPPSHHRAEARSDREADRARPEQVRSTDRGDDEDRPQNGHISQSGEGGTWGNSPRLNQDRQQGLQAAGQKVQTQDIDTAPRLGKARCRRRADSRADRQDP